VNHSVQEKILQAAEILRKSKFTTAYTGAGISVESGIPPFRGEGGLWSKYDPKVLDIDYFLSQPAGSWKVIKEIFYDFFGKATPNRSHFVLAEMQSREMVARIITQNIDNLHQEAGSNNVYEFHGNCRNILCLNCFTAYKASEISFDHLPPTCRQCGGLLKPGFVFFGESIPQSPLTAAYEAAMKSDVFLIIGTTGEVMPANQIPVIAKNNGATIIEVNPNASNYTRTITDIFLQGRATEVMDRLSKELFSPSLDYDQDRIDEDLEVHGK
jgi:NAD-dependent deacetylase